MLLSRINNFTLYNTDAHKKHAIRNTMALPVTKTISFKGESDKVSLYEKDTESVCVTSESLKNRSIGKLYLTKPGSIKGFFNDYDFSVTGSKIGQFVAFKDKNYRIAFVRNNEFGAIDNAHELAIANNTKIKSIKNTSFVNIFGNKTQAYHMGCGESHGYPDCKNIESLFLSIQGEVKDIDNIKSNNVCIGDAKVNIDNIKTQKLSIEDLNHLNGRNEKPVKIKFAEVTDTNVLNFYSHSKIDNDYKSGFAEIDNAEIQTLFCKNLSALDSNLDVVSVDSCESIKNTKIKSLTTKKIGNIENSTIDELIFPSGKFNIRTDDKSSIGAIRFAKSGGSIVFFNRGQHIPSTKVVNGSVSYNLKDIRRNNLTIEDKDTIVTLSGNSVIDNIKFKNGGKVILQNDEKGIHPDISKIKVTNGEIVKDYPLKGFEKVAGMDELKRQLREDVIEPLTNPAEYKAYGLDVLNGFLLYGPPGCGKTFITRMLAEETKRNFVELPVSSVGSKYQHETVENISRKFQEAKNRTPSILFIDEVEAMVPSREGLAEWDTETNERVTELLQQINNCKEKDVLVVCASNEPQKIDNAIKRTGRMDKRIFLGPPDLKTREELFKMTLTAIDKKENDIDLEKLAKASELYTAEDIRMVVREAAVEAMRNKSLISTESVLKALKIVKPSLNSQMVEYYKSKGEA